MKNRKSITNKAKLSIYDFILAPTALYGSVQQFPLLGTKMVIIKIPYSEIVIHEIPQNSEEQIENSH